MHLTESKNRRIALQARPRGMPTFQDFQLETHPVPVLEEGHVLLRTLFLSIDPYMRNMMDAAGPDYAPPVAIGGTMVGGTVSRVAASRNADFAVGDIVLANAGWQDFLLSDGSDLLPIGDLAQPSLALGALGMPGFTAYVGLLDIAQLRPGETVVVAAATGAVGSMVGQIAKARGARVVGVAGGADKCDFAIRELGFDACIDRRGGGMSERLKAACPNGIHIYFENVGGEVLDAVLPHLSIGARVPVCGFIAHYNDVAPNGPDRRADLLATVLQKRIRMQGFIILDHYGPRFNAFRSEMERWLADGQIKAREDFVEGLEQAPEALIRLLEGRNFGKLVVKVSQD